MSKYPPTQELPPLGALCLDYTDDIHRPPGDPLNPDSFFFPLIHEKVKRATVQNIVFSGVLDESFIDNFADACNNLKAKGAIGIITSCGFLAQIQGILSSKIDIPLATSSLLQIPSVMTILSPRKKVAVLTFDENELSKFHFDGIGIPEAMQERIIVHGTKKGGELKNIIIEGGQYVIEKFEAEMVELAEKAVAEDDSIGAFVLECTQMPPTSKAIQDSLGLPVYDVITMIDWFYSGIVSRTLPEDTNKSDGLRIRKRSSKEKGE
ncbi:uncharacterized protein PRCAT00005059001 [Priceomyces carsonii]|uniref:uncharacterized protein n=1 Tax=Priceomyces carsonii TaxID=28549 RepID=UPI002ED8CCF2|nr:unnamed protein product [Priceomyces carsonii]